MESVKIGKSSIEIRSKGCIDCGTEHSAGWTHIRTVPVIVDGRKPINVSLSICADCSKARLRKKV